MRRGRKVSKTRCLPYQVKNTRIIEQVKTGGQHLPPGVKENHYFDSIFRINFEQLEFQAEVVVSYKSIENRSC